MKLLEEKGLRNKIINECIKKENHLKEIQTIYLDNNTADLRTRINDLIMAKEMSYAIAEISDLRTRLMQLLDNEKVE